MTPKMLIRGFTSRLPQTSGGSQVDGSPSLPSRLPPPLDNAIDCLELLFGEWGIGLQCIDVLVQLGHRSRPDEDAGDALIPQQPADGHLREALPSLLCYLIKLIEQLYVLFRDRLPLEEVIFASPALLGNGASKVRGGKECRSRWSPYH